MFLYWMRSAVSQEWLMRCSNGGNTSVEYFNTTAVQPMFIEACKAGLATLLSSFPEDPFVRCIVLPESADFASKASFVGVYLGCVLWVLRAVRCKSHCMQPGPTPESALHAEE